MADDTKTPRKPEPAPPDPGPHYYIAAEDLYVGHPDAAAFPARAFAAGDRVPAALVDANGWQQQVRYPDDYPPPRPAPATATPDHGKEQ